MNIFYKVVVNLVEVGFTYRCYQGQKKRKNLNVIMAEPQGHKTWPRFTQIDLARVSHVIYKQY